MKFEENKVYKAKVKVGCDGNGIDTIDQYEGKSFNFLYRKVEGIKNCYGFFIVENDSLISDSSKFNWQWDASQLDFSSGNLEIKIKYHVEGLERVKKIKGGDWLDLRSSQDYELSSNNFYMIDLGVSIKIPEGYEAHLAPRSSTFKNYGIVQSNSFGIIDQNFSGEDDCWMLPVFCLRSSKINKNDRICQFRIIEKMPEVDIIEVDYMEDESRGGFGSTGVN